VAYYWAIVTLLDLEIRCSILVRAPRERVFDAITVAEHLDGWFTVGAEIDARAGGHIKFRWKDWGADNSTQEDGGPILEFNRPERFVFQWHPDGPSYYTTVTLEFIEDPRGTIIKLHERGYHDTPSGRKAFVGCATGWGEALALLKFWVEHNIRY
jgi:uncharacterized protein YndB with AHSA1/START domain